MNNEDVIKKIEFEGMRDEFYENLKKDKLAMSAMEAFYKSTNILIDWFGEPLELIKTKIEDFYLIMN